MLQGIRWLVRHPHLERLGLRGTFVAPDRARRLLGHVAQLQLDRLQPRPRTWDIAESTDEEQLDAMDPQGPPHRP